MNKIRVIDLLNKIANDIDVPPKNIKYNDKYFEYKLWLEPNKYAYVEKGKNNTLEEYCCFYDLNDEVEVIEEDNKIEKIYEDNDDFKNDKRLYRPTKNIKVLANKINEIIDYLEEKENE